MEELHGVSGAWRGRVMVERKRHERTVFQASQASSREGREINRKHSLQNHSFSKQVTAVSEFETHPIPIPYSNDTIGCCCVAYVAEAFNDRIPEDLMNDSTGTDL